MHKQVKALVLFSGGLDSILAAELLRRQGIAVTGAAFVSNFFSAGNARNSAQMLGLDLKVVDISKEILSLVKNPPHGYGKNLNPCVDCHALMARRAALIAKKEGFDIIASGEVLGQRPFSQNKPALALVAKTAGTEILRPLSAKLLPPTGYERAGLVKREELLDISGRGRGRQEGLIKKFKIRAYPTPAGGCLLTDRSFSARLAKLIDYWPKCTDHDSELLKFGRIFWVKQTKQHDLLVIARDRTESERLEELAQMGDFVLKLKEIPGPTALLRPGKKRPAAAPSGLRVKVAKNKDLGDLDVLPISPGRDRWATVAANVAYFSTKARGREVEVVIKQTK